jgi:hypothetical protein
MFLVIKSELDFRTRARRVEKCSEGFFSLYNVFSKFGALGEQSGL